MRATLVASVGETATSLISDPERGALYIGARSGRILRLPVGRVSGSVAPQPEGASLAFDLTGSVSTDGERGLLDMELLEGGDRVAVSYTEKDGSVVLRVLRLGEAGLVDDLPSPVVLRVPHPIAGHNGGGLALGEGAELFLSLGDMDSRHYDLPLAQDPESPLGSIVTIPAEVLEPDGTRPIDPLGALVAKGLRNPWRIAFDPEQDVLWIGDVGESSREEISVLPVPADDAVVNFGWPGFEGSKPFQQSATGIDGEPIPPVFEYEHSSGRCSIVLGGIYHGEAVTAMKESMVFGDFCSGDILAARVDGTSIANPRKVAAIDGQIVSFGEDARGEVYALTVEGDVYRLDPGYWVVPDVAKSPEGFAPDTTSVTIEHPSEAECRLVSEILSVRYFASLSPAEMQSRLFNLISTLEVAVATAPPNRVEHLTTLLRIFTRVEQVAQASGFRGSDPAVETLVDEVLAGTGWSSGFHEAVNSVMGLQGYCA